MTDAQPPFVVLVHGAWHGAWCWSSLQTELDSRGIASFAIDLPGHGTSLEPFGDLYGDVDHVTKVLEKLRRPIVLVGHSYGGAVITQAAASVPNVARLVYVTAFVPDVGESVTSLLRSMPQATAALNTAIIPGDDGLSTVDPNRAHEVFYGHCSPEVTPAHIARLCPQPSASFVQPLTAAAWHDTASTFIRCTDDNAIPLLHQDFMAERCSEVITLETDHSPFASMPAQTADIISRLARAEGHGAER